jgi:DNA-binding transcriptional LysR family regulator
MRPTALDAQLVHSFVSICDAGGFAKASVRLNLSQSTISGHIKRLEALVGRRLIDRHNGRKAIKLTRWGETFLSHARDVVAANDIALACFKPDLIAGTVRFATTEDMAATVVPTIIEKFLDQHPGVEVEIHTGVTSDMRHEVGTRYDLVVAVQPCRHGGGEVLHRDQLVWVTSRNQAAHRRTPLPLALYPEGCLYRSCADAALRKVKRDWRPAIVSASRSALDAAVMRGLAITVVPAKSVPASMHVLTRAAGLPALPEIEIALYRKQATELPAARALADCLSQHLRGRKPSRRGAGKR